MLLEEIFDRICICYYRLHCNELFINISLEHNKFLFTIANTNLIYNLVIMSTDCRHQRHDTELYRQQLGLTMMKITMIMMHEDDDYDNQADDYDVDDDYDDDDYDNDYDDYGA